MSVAPETLVGEAFEQIRRQNTLAIGILNLAGNAMETRHAELTIELPTVLVAHAVEVMVETWQSASVVDEIYGSLGFPCEPLVVDNNQPISVFPVESLAHCVPGEADWTTRTGKGIHPAIYGEGLGRLEHPGHQQGVLTIQ